MQKKVLLAMLLVILCSLIISYGCGGGDGVTQPPSLSTPIPKTAYINVKIVWPKAGIPGSCIFSSGNGNSLTAAMPSDTKRIEVKVLEYNDPNNVLGKATITDPNTTGQISVKLDNNSDNILPAVKVKIWAGAYINSDPNSTDKAVSEVNDDFTIIVGINNVTLNLGNYNYGINLNPASILKKDGEFSTITFNLKIKYPDPNALDSHVSDRQITFKVVSGSGCFCPVGSNIVDPNNKQYSVNTEPNGVAQVKLVYMYSPPLGRGQSTLTGSAVETIEGEASFQAGDQTYPIHFSVNLIPPNLELRLEANPTSIHLGEQSAVTATLVEYLTQPTPIPTLGGSISGLPTLTPTPTIRPPSTPVPGKEIKFMLQDPNTGTLSAETAVTDQNGQCHVFLSGRKPGKIKVNAGYLPISEPPGYAYTGTCNVNVPGINYVWQALAIPHPIYFAPPDFQSPYFTQDNTLTVQSVLQKDARAPAAGERIKFSIIEGNAVVSPAEGITDNYGNCITTVSTDTTIPAPRTIKIQAELESNDPNAVIPAPIIGNIAVLDGKLFEDNFDSYNTFDDIKTRWAVVPVNMMYPERNTVTGGTVQLYTDPAINRTTGPIETVTINPAANLLLGHPVEVRFSVKNGDEHIEEIIPELPILRRRGIFCGFSSGTPNNLILYFQPDDWVGDYYNQHLVTGFNKICYPRPKDDGIGSISVPIAEFSGGWDNIRVQSVPAYQGRSKKVIFWINGAMTVVDDTNLMSVPFAFGSQGGTVWYDNVTIYDLNGLKLDQ